jgi:CRISPR/Cas system-associated protein Cas10 (large subunit of type III CRISPR-Cas system)
MERLLNCEAEQLATALAADKALVAEIFDPKYVREPKTPHEKYSRKFEIARHDQKSIEELRQIPESKRYERSLRDMSPADLRQHLKGKRSVNTPPR